MRLSIEVTPEQHQRLKAIAALSGKTIRDYVLERVLNADMTENEALKQLEDFLKPRIEAAERGDFSSKDFDGVIAEARAERSAR